MSVNTISVSCVVFPAKPATFQSLLTNPKTYNVKDDSISPTKCELIYDPDGLAKFGGFKRALFGHTSIPILNSSSRICIKQCYYPDKGSTTRHIYDSASQVNFLSRDINCSRWATASMEIVYEFIAHSKCGTPPFEIPKMRYVKVALAIAENNTRDTFLLEEVIDDDLDGPFVKYIGNGSAVPIRLASPDRAHIAAFLAFAQHVQYEKTKKMVFVADFQGMVFNLQFRVCLMAHLLSTRWPNSAHRSPDDYPPVCDLSRLFFQTTDQISFPFQ